MTTVTISAAKQKYVERQMMLISICSKTLIGSVTWPLGWSPLWTAHGDPAGGGARTCCGWATVRPQHPLLCPVERGSGRVACPYAPPSLRLLAGVGGAPAP